MVISLRAQLLLLGMLSCGTEGVKAGLGLGLELGLELGLGLGLGLRLRLGS